MGRFGLVLIIQNPCISELSTQVKREGRAGSDSAVYGEGVGVAARDLDFHITGVLSNIPAHFYRLTNSYRA